MLNKIKFRPDYTLAILIILATLFSFWLMFHTLSRQDGTLKIAVKVWSDFAGTIPLIRSFSLGENIPPEYPLFSGEPIRYHFLFYFFVGLLEKIGLPLDLAFNLPSALSFTLLIISIYFLSSKLFKSKIVGLLSVLFFLFNGSLSFLEFFKSHPLSIHTLSDISKITEYPSFAPYGSGTVSAFWNLNIYTNQRHLALPLALFLLMIFWLINQKPTNKKFDQILSSTFWGIFLGILLYAHSSIFIMAVATLAILFLLSSNLRLHILIIAIIGFIIALPRALFLKETAGFSPHLEIGYLISNQFTITNFLKYWFVNLGLFWPLLLIGFLYSSSIAKKILISFLSLFIIGNTIQFSPEIAGNHKFFNVFVIVGNMFVAFALVKFWKLNNWVKPIIPILIFFLIFSGIIDFFPLKNDGHITIADYPKNPDILWIMNNTPKEAIFLNSTYLYHPATLAGRKIYYGWPYFAWSLGHNTHKREAGIKAALSSNDKLVLCEFLNKNRISYLEISPSHDIFTINEIFWQQNFKPIYSSVTSNFSIYQTSKMCS